MKKTIFGLLIMFLVFGLAQLVSAVTINTTGFDIVVDVDDDKVKPGESFNVEVEVTNIAGLDIEDINVEVIVEKIDDGDDLEEDDDINDLDATDDDNIDFDFEVPYAVRDKEYQITVIVTGDQANDTSIKFETQYNATVEVEKDKHELVMKQPTLDYETLKCSRRTEVSVVLWNIGEKDEEVELTLYNTELQLSEKQIFDLDEGRDEDDIKTRKIFSLDLIDAEAKTYTFYVKAVYDEGDEQETESFNVKVEECPTAAPEEEEVVVTTTTPITTTPVITTAAIIEEEGFIGKYGAALLLGLLYIVVIVVGVYLVVYYKRKR